MKQVHDCWNRIGVWGDGSCPELGAAVHCRNCPTYSAAASQILDREIDPEYLAHWAQHFRAERKDTVQETDSLVIFRIGPEWLALSTSVFHEVCDLRPIHSLPPRRNGTVL